VLLVQTGANVTLLPAVVDSQPSSSSSSSSAWQTDGTTTSAATTLFDFVATRLP
jgi:hypothetical protein